MYKFLKNKLLYIIVGITLAAVVLAFKVQDDARKEKLIQDVLAQSLQGAHYENHYFNDEFSGHVFDEFIEEMDYQKHFFIESDYNAFNDSRLLIDDQIQSGTFDFFNQVHDTLIQRIAFVETFYKELLSEPFDYDKKEEYYIDFENLNYVQTPRQLQERWRKALKYQILSNITTKLLNQEKTEQDKSKWKPFDEFEKQARAEVLKTHQDWFRRMNQLRRRDRLNIYFNAITASFDPHTQYFAPKAKEDFDIRISGKLEGIGASLQEDNGLIKVVQIVPGSASWRQGDLQANDVILKVAQGNEEPVSIVNMRIDDAVKLIRGKKGTEVRLTVQKIDGTKQVIPIIRDIVVFEESYAKSTILQHNGKKIGYIYLPQFYVDFSNPQGRRCSKDVEQAVKELQQEGIDGLVLDLRNNGGGSLQDVVDMTGLFIKTGPVVQVRDKKGKVQVLKDYNPAVQYKGPFTVMINTFSASASEILAAAIQDYERGLVVGANSYGKGTVQQFYDFDNFFPNQNEELKPLGSLKITTQKFYRINGGSTQLKGVQPDILLPDSYQLIEIAEREHDNAIAWDEIQSASYTEKNKVEASLIEQLKKKSLKRISKNTTFDLILQNAQRLKRQRELKFYPLALDDYLDFERTRRLEAEKFNDIEQKTDMKIIPTVSEKNILNGTDTLSRNRIENWHKNLMKDIDLWETANITTDLIKATK